MRRKSNWRNYEVAPADDAFLAATQNADDSDVQLSDDDMELLNEFGTFSSFLTNLNPHELLKNKVAKMNAPWKRDRVAPASDEESDKEANFESKPRPFNSDWTKEESGRLPIKMEDGRIEIPALPAPVNVVEDVIKEVEPKIVPETEAKPKAPKESAKKVTEKQIASMSASSIEEEIGSLASTIMGDPEHHLKDLAKLRAFAVHKNAYIKKLAYLAQLAVFKDIIPGYRIRKRSDKEENVKLSKEVDRVKRYEESLLQQYQNYLQQLEEAIKGEKADESILTVAIQCMADLLKTVPHFNFRTNLLNMVVTYMPVKTPEQVSAICCNSIKTIFKDDESGEISLEAVKLISKMIKARSYKVNTHAVETFLHLRLREELIFDKPEKEKESTAKKRKKEGEHVTRKTRKVLKVDDELKKELQEAEATYSKAEKQKMQSETLKFVFVTYFRVLKNAPGSDLLATVLEGLSKFAHLINIDFFNDLMSVLKKITHEQQAAYHSGVISGPEGIRGIRNALHCVIAAFQVLAGQGEMLHIDLGEFYTSMYAQMIRISMDPNASILTANVFDEDRNTTLGGAADAVEHLSLGVKCEIELLLQGLELMFFRKKQIPLARVTAFVKRVAVMSLSMAPSGILACLAMIRSLMVRFPKLDSLFDAESRVGTGVYSPYLDDPELCNAVTSNLWEISHLTTHFHPMVQKFARHILEMSTEKYQSGVRRQINPEFTLSPSQYLSKYDPFKAAKKKTVKSGMDFAVFPVATIPGTIKTFIKRKKENTGIKFLDGPTTLGDSLFLQSIAATQDRY